MTSNYFKDGVRFLRDHPQIWSTALLALAIFAAFVYVALQFSSIAQNAQEELQDVRIGSVLDSFALFAPDYLDRPEELRDRMQQIAAQNQTMRSFRILAPHDTAWRVYVDLERGEEGQVTDVHALFYTFAFSEPNETFRTSLIQNGERVFLSARALTDQSGDVEAIAVAELSLASADVRIANSIRTSMMVLGGILVVLLVLFFRHARIIDYATLYRKQREIDEMKDSFISMASHELKSPLSVIRGYVSFLKEGTGTKKEQTEYLRRIDVSADELRQLIDDILDVSRIEQGRLRFSPTYLVPAEIAQEVVELFDNQAKKKGLQIRYESTDADKTQIRVDGVRLRQIITNLVSNASKYTLEGEITVSCTATADEVTIAVRDTGIGLTADEQKKLFGKFYRVEADETKSVSGTGLGLWITKYLVEAMGGRITVESIKGTGSKFSASFPIQKERDAEHGKSN